MRRLRSLIATMIWLGCAGCSLVLGGAVLAVALNADQAVAWVPGLMDLADRLGLGVLTVADGLWESSGRHPEVKNALVNWGLAALGWLVVGWAADRLVRPRRRAVPPV